MKFFASAVSGTRARWFRFSVAPILLISTLGLALLGAGCSDETEDVTFPAAPPPEEMNWLFDVFGTAADDVYACGNKGAMFHFDGESWGPALEMGTGSPITKIWGPDGGPLYAIGHAGNLWQMVAGSWSGQTSGTSKNLYGIGIFAQELHITGADGTLRKLNGNSWDGVGQIMVIRNPGGNHAVEDTLMLNEDVISLMDLNEYFIVGAYKTLDYEGEYIGLNGTDGMVMSTDEEPENYDWELRPLGDDEFALSEWMMCTTSSPNLNDNYLGTSEGWIFQLVESDDGENVWSKMSPDATDRSKSGIRDMWLDENSNLYFVTDSGYLYFQTQDYNFSEDIGTRKSFHISHGGLTSVWGADTDHIFMTGFTENTIFHASMDFTDTTLVFTADTTLEFPNKGGQSIGMFEDQFGMPRF
jgi:hypothetical protein